MKNTFLVIMLAFTSSFLSAQTDQIEKRDIKTQKEKEDFEEKVQRPFTRAYLLFKGQIKELSGSENNAREFLNQIPDLLNQIDSLKAALYVQTYKNATITYQMATMGWICSHVGSFKAPGLIIQWWPKDSWGLIYNALSEEVKRSKSGQNLKGLIENP